MKNSNSDLNNMMCLDLFLSGKKEDTVKNTQKIKPTKTVYPLMSFDLSGNSMMKHIKSLDKEKLFEFSNEFNWDIDIDQVLKPAYEALVVTNVDQLIVWANEGFKKMTGYTSHYAIGRKPSFLQGINTSEEVKKNIREKLAQGKPFTEVIVNYRKNKEEYFCEVSIIPLRNQQNQIVHFLALEKAV